MTAESNLLFSVVIPTFNRPDSLRKTLECLHPERQAPLSTSTPSGTITYEVIVSDDSPGDETRKMIEQSFPWVRYTRGPQKGPAANRNHGASIAKGTWLAFTDDDCLPDPQWLFCFSEKTLIAKVLEGKTIADRPQCRLDEQSPINDTGGYLWSCNFGIERALFLSLGGFDTAFPFPAMEDVEFRIRLQRNSIRYLFCPEAFVIHPWRKAKGLPHLRVELLSWFYLLKLHPGEKPSKLWVYFLHRALRTLVKVTIPMAFRYGFRGFPYALRVDAFYAWQGIRCLFGFNIGK